MNEVVLYQTPDNQTELEVKFDGDTVWLTQNQLAELFQGSRTNIVEHIKNLYKTAELDEHSTCRKFRHVQPEGKRTVERQLDHYNLDVIIAVGYRVNSKKGTQFRQWATQRLKDYILKGNAINQKRLDELGKMVQRIEQSGKTDTLQSQEASGLLEILGSYTRSFVLLNQYDSHSVQTGKLSENITYEIQYDEATNAIAELKRALIAKKEATELFGNEKDESFRSSLQSVAQTFGGQYLYPTIEEQAAHLLYFVIKNHSFTDGNKRIGAFLFVWFLEKNRHRFKKTGELKINDNGLIAIALLVAQSKPEEKEIIVQLIVSLIADSQ